MADADRWLKQLAGFLPAGLLLFLAATFLLPSGPAYSLVFYTLVLIPALAASAESASSDWGVWLAAGLIVWSGATVLWGQDDGNRALRFLIDSFMTLGFLAAMLGGLALPRHRARLATMLIWAGTANALLSLGLNLFNAHASERLHGWGATSHPILGACVMGMAFLTALTRLLTWRAGRWISLAGCLAMGLFILMTESRGPLLAVSAAALFLCAAGPWRWRALGALAALAIGWRLLPAGVRAHDAAVLVNRGSSHRFEIWHRTLQMIGQRPLFGHGLAANLDLPGITFPHDLYLSVLFYSGIVGFVLFASLCVVLTLRLWRRTERLWLAALWMNALLSGLTDLGQITKGPGPLWLIFWLPVGLILAGGKEAKKPFFWRRLNVLPPGTALETANR